MTWFGCRNYNLLLITYTCLTLANNIKPAMQIADQNNELVFGEESGNEFDKYKATPNEAFVNDTLTLRSLKRRRRAVIAWPKSATNPIRNSQAVADYYVNIDIPTPQGTFMPITMEAKFTYFFPDVDYSTGRSLEDRRTIFGLIESFLDNFGVNGRSCIKRALCERYENHILVDGIIGEFISLLFEYESLTEGDGVNEYFEARNHGRCAYGCEDRYYDCPFSIFTLLQS